MIMTTSQTLEDLTYFRDPRTSSDKPAIAPLQRHTDDFSWSFLRKCYLFSSSEEIKYVKQWETILSV